MDESKSTGERLYTGYFDRYSVEHLHRYAIARSLVAGKVVLDIASGEGYGSNLLAEFAARVIGVDIDGQVIEHAKVKYPKENLTFLQGSTDAIPAADSSIDVVVSFETLEHHDRHEEMYREIKRVLTPRGLLMISTPDKRHFSELSGHRNDFHVKELHREEFVGLTQRFFSKVVVRSQVSSVASIVCGGEDAGLFNLFGGDHRQIQAASALADPAYHICFASDGEIPSVHASVFESRRVLAQHDIEGSHLRNRLAGQVQMNEDLRRSLSFRLGSALAAPLRALMNRRTR